MRYQHPLKQILKATRGDWDRPGTRLAVRQDLDKVSKCGTLALGAEVFASDDEQRVVPHTCKSRSCPGWGIEPQFSGNGSDGPTSPIFLTLGSCLLCPMSCGQSSSKTAISSTTCRNWVLRWHSSGQSSGMAFAC